MASFEGMRSGGLWRARERRGGRYLPLYAAGIVGGLGLALGLTFASDGGSASEAAPAPALTHTTAAAPVAPRDVLMPPESVQPDARVLLAGVELPLNAMALYVPEPVVPEPAPAAEPVAQPAAAPVTTSPAATQPAPVTKPAPPPPAPAEKPNFYLPSVSGGPATDLESRLLAGINTERANAGLAGYTYDPELTKLARMRAQQMADQGYFGHVDPYGYSMYTELLQRFGFRYAWAGENLAMNNYSVGESPERAVVSLMKSPTHAANILASDFYRIGIGEVTTADGRHIYAMIFLG